ncbi:hypothetical protein [uncultured Selenomonas sp.]|uniref:tellurite resistance TerB family protein n=1 Tax=uncultured Selenomonas sp. TaxID=159275 RepID=UPI0025F6C9E2|nr:hypothetical protein [uncultured Selenomonas sp.]
MFLKLLKPEEKALFLEFAYSLVHEDGRFEESEKEMIEAYCEEMGVTFDLAHAPRETHALVKKMAETMTLEEKKIAFFELIGLAMADGDYGEEERTAMKDLEEAFGMTEAYGQTCETLLKEYFVLQQKMTAAVLD